MTLKPWHTDIDLRIDVVVWHGGRIVWMVRQNDMRKWVSSKSFHILSTVQFNYRVELEMMWWHRTLGCFFGFKPKCDPFQWDDVYLRMCIVLLKGLEMALSFFTSAGRTKEILFFGVEWRGFCQCSWCFDTKFFGIWVWIPIGLKKPGKALSGLPGKEW